MGTPSEVSIEDRKIEVRKFQPPRAFAEGVNLARSESAFKVVSQVRRSLNSLQITQSINQS